MKKLIILALFMTLFTAYVFSEIAISGLIGTGVTLLQDTTEEDHELKAGGFVWGRLQMNVENEAKTTGGVLRIMAGLYTLNTAPQYTDIYAWAWWKPIKQVKLHLGFIDDFSTAEIVGWGFNGNDAEDYIASAGYEYTNGIFGRATGFYNGTWWTGAALMVTPIEGMAINLAFPFNLGNLAGAVAKDVYQHTNAQISYSIPGIGRAALSFEGKGGQDLEIGNAIVNPDSAGPLGYESFRANASTLYVSFLVNALNNMGIGLNIGFAYTLPAESGDFTYNSPLAAGLGFSYDRGKFSVRTRFAATFLGTIKETGGDSYEEPFKLGIGVIPSYDFGILKLYLNAGISFMGKETLIDGNDDEVDNSPAFGWHVNPYVTKRIGSCTFFGGVSAESFGTPDDSKPIIQWKIMLAFQYEI